MQDLPPDVELPPLVLQFPHVVSQGGADPLVAVPHVGFVAHHSGLVLDLGVEAPGAGQGAVD